MANDIQAYQEMLQEQPSIINDQRIAQLNQRLDPRLIKQRRSGGGMVKYIQGHSAMDQANRIFGYGNWGYRTVSVEQVVLEDPIAHEAVGIEYRAIVEVTIRGCLPISDTGSQPVTTWNVEDQIMQRRLKTANYNKTPVDEGPFTPIEKREARAVIVDAHEAAKKGAVTDALKRALRSYGNQFGNELYGDGHVDVSDAEPGRTTVNSDPPANINAAANRPQIAAPANNAKVVDSHAPVPTSEPARTGRAVDPNAPQIDPVIRNLKSQAVTLGIVHNLPEWSAYKESVLGKQVSDRDLQEQQIATLRAAMDHDKQQPAMAS